RVVAGPAVSEPDIEIPVGTERDLPTVVIGEGLLDVWLTARPDQIETRGWISFERVRRRARETRDDGVTVGVGEAEEDATAISVIGRERQAEQPAFAG